MVEPPARASVRVVAGLITRGERYLITQRRPTAVLPLLWEFPGGRVEPDESDRAALAREIHHRLGVRIEVGTLISFVNHSYTKYSIELYLYECSIVAGEPRELNVHAFRWASSTEFDQYAFTPADDASVARLLGLDT
jgi:8-oxo-dGTP diphosphatase